MALPANTIFRVFPTAGADTNGGGFVPGSSGTDWSQQNAAQYALTGLTSAGAGNTLLSAAASADMVGNIAQTISGANLTIDFFEVVSVVVGVSITFSTSQSGASIATGVVAAGVLNIGGALATVAKAPFRANNTVAIKTTGTYTTAAALTINSLDSTPAPGNPLTFVGYSSTIGDAGIANWTTSTNSIDLVDFTASRNVTFQNIAFSSTAGTPGDGFQAKTTGNSFLVSLINCSLAGFLVGVEGNFTVNWTFVGLIMAGCTVTGCTSHCVRNAGTTYLLACDLKSSTGDSFNSATTGNLDSAYIFENVVTYACANGFNFVFSNTGGTTNPIIVLRNCVGSTHVGAGAVFENANNPTAQISNCIFDANGTYGIDGSPGTTTLYFLLYSNAFYNNTLAATRNLNAGISTITLTASPYVAVGTNFALNLTPGGGLLLIAKGFPGTFGVGTGFADVGALQTKSGLAGGGLVVPGITQGRKVIRQR